MSADERLVTSPSLPLYAMSVAYMLHTGLQGITHIPHHHRSQQQCMVSQQFLRWGLHVYVYQQHSKSLTAAPFLAPQ